MNAGGKISKAPRVAMPTVWRDYEATVLRMSSRSRQQACDNTRRTCSIESIRRCKAPIAAVNSRARVVLPRPWEAAQDSQHEDGLLTARLRVCCID